MRRRKTKRSDKRCKGRPVIGEGSMDGERRMRRGRSWNVYARPP